MTNETCANCGIYKDLHPVSGVFYGKPKEVCKKFIPCKDCMVLHSPENCPQNNGTKHTSVPQNSGITQESYRPKPQNHKLDENTLFPIREETGSGDSLSDLSKEDLKENLVIAIGNIARLEKKVNKRRNKQEGFAWGEGYQKAKEDYDKEKKEAVKNLKEEIEERIAEVRNPDNCEENKGSNGNCKICNNIEWTLKDELERIDKIFGGALV